MWTLASSLVATTEAGWGELRSLATGQRWDVRPEDLSLVRALAIGIPDAEADKHRELAAAVKLGWAAQADSTADAQVREHIEKIERCFAWCPAPREARDLVLAAQSGRRHLHRGFSQHAALPETVARRAAVLDAPGQNVLVLGDTDFASLALLQLGHRVTVLEPDNATAELIRRGAPHSAPLEVIVHDLREPLPERLVGAFDAFFTDPLSGPGALRLALARGLATVKADGRGFICVSEAGAHSFEILAGEFGVDVTDRYSDYNHYYGYDYAADFHTSDLACVRSSGQAGLKPAPHELYLVRGVAVEDRFLETPASRYTFKNVSVETAQLNQLDAAIQLLERAGRLHVRQRSYYENDGVRTYLVHTKEGSAVFVRLLTEARAGELFVAPADTNLEDALMVVLLGVLRIEGTVVQKRRVRGSSVYAMK